MTDFLSQLTELAGKVTPGPYECIHNSWETSTVYGEGQGAVAECPIDDRVDEHTQDALEAVKGANARFIALSLTHKDEIIAQLQQAERMREAVNAALDFIGVYAHANHPRAKVSLALQAALAQKEPQG